MKKSLLIFLLVASVVALSANPGAAWHRWHGEVFIGIGAPIWFPPPPYYVVPPTPTVVVQQPPVYIQQPPVPQQPPSPPTQTSYWYYCPRARAYYPYVQSCPEPWVTVPTRPLQ